MCWICGSGSFTCSSFTQIGWMLGQVSSQPFWVWVTAGMVRLPALPHHHHQSKLSYTAQASSSFEADKKGLCHFCSHALWLTHWHPHHQDQLYCLPRRGAGQNMFFTGGINVSKSERRAHFMSNNHLRGIILIEVKSRSRKDFRVLQLKLIVLLTK